MEKRESKKRVFFIARSDHDIFIHIKAGKKWVETRAATIRNRYTQVGDRAVFICNKERIEKNIKKVTHFKTIAALLKKYTVRSINPSVKSEAELRTMYESFPLYAEKIKRCGILAFELE